MKLTISDISKIIDIPIKTVYRLMKREKFPTLKVMDQLYFEQADFLEWCIIRNIPIKYNILQTNSNKENCTLLSDAMFRGSIGLIEDENSIGQVIDVIIDKLPIKNDKALISNIIFNKQEIKSLFTYKNEIALPHLRSPIIANVEKPEVWLFYLTDYVSIGTKFIHTWFWILSPTPGLHYHLVERLYRILLNQSFYETIIGHFEWQKIVRKAAQLETELNMSFVNESQEVEI